MKSTVGAEEERFSGIIAELTARSRDHVRILRRIRREHVSLLKKLDASEIAMAKLVKKSGKSSGSKK